MSWDVSLRHRKSELNEARAGPSVASLLSGRQTVGSALALWGVNFPPNFSTNT